MSKIYENNFAYRLLKPYVTWSFKQYYSEYIVRGTENIPVGEPVIFAANHLYALMDALAVLSLPPTSQVKVFLGRSDLFKLPKWIVNFLQFAKIMPVFRIRDGYENLSKNQSSFKEADDVLLHNACISIMPEGNQGEAYKIRPLVKGIFRIAFSAQQKMPDTKSVKILPVGIYSGDFVKFGKPIIINIGKAMDVANYTEQYKENPALATNLIRADLKDKLENLALHIGSDSHYSCFETAIDVVNSAKLIQLQLKDNTYNRFLAKQQTAKQLIELEKKFPNQTNTLEELCNAYRSTIQKVPLRTSNLESKPASKWNVFTSFCKLVFFSLLFIPGYLLNIVPFHLTRIMPKVLGIQFKGFFSSVYFGFSIVIFPLLYMLQYLVIINLIDISWWTIFFAFPFQFLSGKFSFLLYKNIKSILASIRLYKFSSRQQATYHKLLQIKDEITEILIHKNA